MCRHCERLVEDVSVRPALHEMMRLAALRISQASGGPVTADDIDVKFEVTVQPAPRSECFADKHQSVRDLMYRELDEWSR